MICNGNLKKNSDISVIYVAKPNDEPLLFKRDSSLNASSLLLLKVTLPISVKDDAKILLFKK
jgi:hypothetical protein